MPLGVTAKPKNRPGTLLRCVNDSLGKLHYSDDPYENFISLIGNRMTYKNSKPVLTISYASRWLQHKNTVLHSLTKVQRDVYEMGLKDRRYGKLTNRLIKLRELVEEL